MKRRLLIALLVAIEADLSQVSAQQVAPLSQSPTIANSPDKTGQNQGVSPKPQTLSNHVRPIPNIGTPTGGGFRGGTLDSVPIEKASL